jgi:hypothetical protein
MTGNIRLRFVTLNDPTSAMIRFQAGIAMPFTPSHVECVSLDGKSWIGQHLHGGMAKREPGYDRAQLMTLPDGTTSQKFVDLACTPEQQTAFYAYVESKIGQPYDWTSIVSFVDPAWNLHAYNHLICSAIMVAGLRTKRCEYFAMPLTVPFHHISPRDLFLLLSSHVQIDHAGEQAS